MAKITCARTFKCNYMLIKATGGAFFDTALLPMTDIKERDLLEPVEIAPTRNLTVI